MITRTLWTNLLIQAFTFATSVLIARILGPAGRGELALVLLYPQLVACIAFMGVDRATAILAGRGELARPLPTVTKLVLLFSFPAMAAGYITLVWRMTDAHLAGLATIYLAYVPGVYFYMLAISLLNGTGDFIRFNKTRLGFYVVNFLMVFIIWAAMASSSQTVLDWVVFANLASVYGAMLVAMWMLRGFNRAKGEGVAASGKSDMRATLGLTAVFALPVALTQFGGSVYQIVLQQLTSVEALGLFVVFLSYSRLLSPIGSAVGSHVFHLGITGLNSDIARIFRLSLVVYLCCAVPLWLVAGWLVPLIFGRNFVVDGGTVGMLLVSALFSLLADSMAEYLNGQRKANADTVGRIIYLVTLGILGVSLVPLLGLVGMALAMAISDLLRCGYLVRRVLCDAERTIDEFWRIKRDDLIALLHEGKKVVHGLFA